MYLRMPGQIWDVDAKAASNFHRWYRPNDGRYLSPDPIGLAGGEAGYYAYAAGNPALLSDPEGTCPRGWFSVPPGNTIYRDCENGSEWCCIDTGSAIHCRCTECTWWNRFLGRCTRGQNPRPEPSRAPIPAVSKVDGCTWGLRKCDSCCGTKYQLRTFQPVLLRDCQLGCAQAAVNCGSGIPSIGVECWDPLTHL